MQFYARGVDGLVSSPHVDSPIEAVNFHVNDLAYKDLQSFRYVLA